jgi:transposase-like protein
MRKPRAVDREKEQYWRKIFARFQGSGLPFKKFCAQEKLSTNTFQYWRKRLRERDEARGIASKITKGDNRPSNLQQKIHYWLKVIDEINSYDGSVNNYCRTHGLSTGNLHYWQKRLKEMKLIEGVRTGDNGRRADLLFAPVEVLDDITAKPALYEQNNATSSNKAMSGQQQTQRQIAAEFFEPQSGCRVHVFNGADRPTLCALIAALAGAQSSGF